jgi:7SK snRNA methylphosphate capping enzyme
MWMKGEGLLSEIFSSPLRTTHFCNKLTSRGSYGLNIRTMETPTAGTEEEFTRRERHNILHAINRHGNYKNYYSFRTDSVPDGRLTALSSDVVSSAGERDILFYCKDKIILDLGCNAGKITREVLEFGGATKAIGIDIDEVLIQQALDLGIELKDDPNKIEFIVGDFMEMAYFTNTSIAQPDVILLLSITKWLHLNHGDLGLINLFQALFELLPSDGILVIEPQEWLNYKTAVKKNKDLRPVFKTLAMRPNFDVELKGVGFDLVEIIEREEGGEFARGQSVYRTTLIELRNPHRFLSSTLCVEKTLIKDLQSGRL